MKRDGKECGGIVQKKSELGIFLRQGFPRNKGECTVFLYVFHLPHGLVNGRTASVLSI